MVEGTLTTMSNLMSSLEQSENSMRSQQSGDSPWSTTSQSAIGGLPLARAATDDVLRRASLSHTFASRRGSFEESFNLMGLSEPDSDTLGRSEESASAQLLQWKQQEAEKSARVQWEEESMVRRAVARITGNEDQRNERRRSHGDTTAPRMEGVDVASSLPSPPMPASPSTISDSATTDAGFCAALVQMQTENQRRSPPSNLLNRSFARRNALFVGAMEGTTTAQSSAATPKRDNRRAVRIQVSDVPRLLDAIDGPKSAARRILTRKKSPDAPTPSPSPTLLGVGNRAHQVQHKGRKVEKKKASKPSLPFKKGRKTKY